MEFLMNITKGQITSGGIVGALVVFAQQDPTNAWKYAIMISIVGIVYRVTDCIKHKE